MNLDHLAVTIQRDREAARRAVLEDSIPDADAAVGGNPLAARRQGPRRAGKGS